MYTLSFLIVVVHREYVTSHAKRNNVFKRSSRVNQHSLSDRAADDQNGRFIYLFWDFVSRIQNDKLPSICGSKKKVTACITYILQPKRLETIICLHRLKFKISLRVVDENFRLRREKKT